MILAWNNQLVNENYMDSGTELGFELREAKKNLFEIF